MLEEKDLSLSKKNTLNYHRKDSLGVWGKSYLAKNMLGLKYGKYYIVTHTLHRKE